MAQQENLKNFRLGGLDSDSAPEYVAQNDYLEAYNIRVSGTANAEEGYVDSIESNTLITSGLPSGITKTVGRLRIESMRIAVFAKYNSNGYHQFTILNFDLGTETAIYTDKTNSNGVSLLNFQPDKQVVMCSINDTFLAWTDGISPIGFANIQEMISGANYPYLAEDMSLAKPQNLVPITAVYASDAGKAANFIKTHLFQFASQFVSVEYTYSAFSTWSKRIIPQQESTPTIGTDVTQNNCIIVTVNCGSVREKTINIAARSGTDIFYIVKSVDRSYVTALPNTAIDLTQEVYEAYDPVANTYSFVFYNQNVAIPVPPTDTDLAYDKVSLAAEAIANINNNILAIGGLTEGYPRPSTSVNITPIGYSPNLSVPAANVNPNPLNTTYVFYGSSGSGAGNHKRVMVIELGGVPQTGDTILVTVADIRNAGTIQQYPSSGPLAVVNNDLGATARSLAQQIPNSTVMANGGNWRIVFTGQPYFGLQSVQITLYNSGATQSKGVHALLDNSSYQAALRYRDAFGRFFPLCTDNTYIFNTKSFAQLNGQTSQLAWTINNAAAPVGAVDYQWMLTPNATTSNLLDVLGSPIHYIGTWDAGANSPTLNYSSGSVGDCYQISVPSTSTTTINLGNGVVPFNSGDYIVKGAKGWDVLPQSFGDLTATGNLLAIKINPLNLYNQRYTNLGKNTVLSYDYSQNDRCTLHYYLTGTTPTYINNPCVDLQVLGYDPATFIVKVEKPSNAFDPSVLNGKNVFLRLYSPKKSLQTASSAVSQTVWYEIGERYTITNGNHDVLNGTITDGDVYFKTRSYQGAVDPSSAYPVLCTDPNFSDFYPSAFSSYGRPGSYYDELENSVRKASIRFSQAYVLGSKVNGLTRFYDSNIYGDGDGETSSSNGLIGVLWPRNHELVVFQENKIGYIPLNLSIIEDAIQQQQVAISEKLMNKIRYSNSGNIGIGKAKESFDSYDNDAWFIDPNRSVPCRVGGDGVDQIAGKMSQFFKRVLQNAYAKNIKIIGYYDRFNSEYVCSIGDNSTTLLKMAFNAAGWNVLDPYTVKSTDITATPYPANGTSYYDPTTGLVTYTPDPTFVGNNTPTFTFNTPSGAITKNACLTWTAGTSTVNPFTFPALTNQPLSTMINSTLIGVQGNNIPVAIGITGGNYSVNGGAFTSVAGYVRPNDVVTVQVMSSASNNTATSCTLTIGTQSATFTVTTIPSGGGGGTTIPNVTIYNKSTSVTIKGTSSIGGTAFGPIYPGLSQQLIIAPATGVTINVTTVFNRSPNLVYTNATGQTEQDSIAGDTVTFTGVAITSSPFIISIQDNA